MRKGRGIFLLMATLVFLSLLGSKNVFAEDEAPNDAYLHYTFDADNGKTIENEGDGGSAYDASLRGNAAIGQGLIGAGGLELGGAPDLVELPRGTVQDCDSITTSIWVNRDRFDTWQAIYSFTNGTNQYMLLTPQAGNDAAGVSLVIRYDYTEGVDKSEQEHRISIGDLDGVIPVKGWYNIVVTIDADTTNARIYVNGELRAEDTDYPATPAMMGATETNVLGAPGGYPDPYFKGQMDDFRIYDRALSEEEVAALFDEQSEAYCDWAFSALELEAGEVFYDLDLPLSLPQFDSLSWASDNEAYLTSEGKVYRPDAGAGDQPIELTATAVRNEKLYTKKFDMTVPDMSAPTPDHHIYQLKNGNPVIPGFYADASILYDDKTEYFFAYGTNDGNGGVNVWPAQIWYSKDLIKWEHQDVKMPEEWFQGNGVDDWNPNPEHKAVWAPSIVYNDKNDTYYVTYCLDGKGHLGKSDSLFGPWVDANRDEPYAPLVNQHDAQFFKDTNGDIYYTFGAWDFGVVKLSFDENGDIFVEEDGDPRRQWSNGRKATPFTYARMQNLYEAFEASEIIERDGKYYLLWSWDGGVNYSVRYAIADDPMGPYREIDGSMTNPILVRDDKKRILGPGHHSVFQYQGEYYIAYHVQTYPYIDMKRLTCIDKLDFNENGSIKKVNISHKGLPLFENSDTRTNLALGRQTRVSSARDYTPGKNCTENFRYDGCFAVNENLSTRWDPGVDAINPWMIVDLGADCDIDSVEYLFEYTNKTYKYKTEYLTQSDAADINLAAASDQWKLYEDNTETGAPASPVEYEKEVKARYVRITMTGAVGLPANADYGEPANGAVGLSLIEFKVYGTREGNDLNRTFEAESFYDQFGIHVEASAGYGVHVSEIKHNNFLKYENVNLDSGAAAFQTRIAPGETGGTMEIRLDSLDGPLIGSLDIGSSTAAQDWKLLSCALTENAGGVHDIYLLFRSEDKDSEIAKIDWFRFGDAGVDKSGLLRLLADAKEKLEGYYVKSTLDNLKSVCQRAEKLLDQADAGQEQISAMEVELLQAIDELIYAGGIQAEYYTLEQISVPKGDIYPKELEEQNKKATVIESEIYSSMEDKLAQYTGRNDYAGVRWTGRIEVPVTGEYVFSTFTDNGGRFFLNGEKLTDWWVNDWEKFQESRTITLTKGELYEFEMQYMELEGGSIAQLYWSINGNIRQAIPATAYRLPVLNTETSEPLLNEAGEKQELDYSEASWQIFSEALQHLESLMEDTFTLQYQLDDAAAQLQAAIDGLVEEDRDILERIEVTKKPSKVVYQIGEELDTSGLEITGYYKSGKSVKIERGYKLSGYDKNKAGKQTVKVVYQEGAVKKETAFNVEVKERPEPGVVKVSRITLNPDKISAAPGRRIKITAAVAPANASDKKVIWKSSDTKVAVVDTSGSVTVKAVGTATVTATAADGSGIVGKAVVTGKYDKAKKISITRTGGISEGQKAARIYLAKGKKLTVKATVSPATAKQGVTYSVSGKSKKIVSVSKKGTIKGKKAGKAVISVRTADKAKKMKLTVYVKDKSKKISNVKLTKKSLNLKVDKTYTLGKILKVTPSNTTQQLTFKSSRKSIVSVDKYGVVSAKKKGKAVITVTGGSKKVKVTVRVK